MRRAMMTGTWSECRTLSIRQYDYTKPGLVLGGISFRLGCRGGNINSAQRSNEEIRCTNWFPSFLGHIGFHVFFGIFNKHICHSSNLYHEFLPAHGVEVTELSTNKQHTLSQERACARQNRVGWVGRHAIEPRLSSRVGDREFLGNDTIQRRGRKS